MEQGSWDQIIKDRYNDAHPARSHAALRHRATRYTLDFESFNLCEFEREGLSAILRIGHSFRRTKSLILGEVDWINHLAAGGVSVARAIRPVAGNLAVRKRSMTGRVERFGGVCGGDGRRAGLRGRPNFTKPTVG